MRTDIRWLFFVLLVFRVDSGWCQTAPDSGSGPASSAIVRQDQSSASDVPAFAAQGAFFAIVVTDLDASLHWYQSNLGLHLIKRGKSPRLPAETAVMGGHNLFVELIHQDGKPLPRIDNEDSVPRLIKAGVILGKKDFDAVEAYLQRHGTQAGIFEDKEMGVHSFLFRDSDGNLIQFFTRNR